MRHMLACHIRRRHVGGDREYHARGRLGGLEERRLADHALDVHGLLVLRAGSGVSDGRPWRPRVEPRQSIGFEGTTHDFELRLGSALVLLVALTLLLCLGSLCMVSCASAGPAERIE